MLKKPGISVNGVSVALNDIGHRIELYYPFKLIRHNLNVPQNRCSPLEQLKKNIDDLQQISEKYHYRTGCVAK